MKDEFQNNKCSYLIFAKASSTFIIMSVYIFSWVSPV